MKDQTDELDKLQELINRIDRQLLEQNGWPVTKLRIIAFILDWKSSENYKRNYPVCPILEIPLTLWPRQQQRDFIHSRVRELLRAEQLPDHELPECTQHETWSDVRDYSVLINVNYYSRREF